MKYLILSLLVVIFFKVARAQDVVLNLKVTSYLLNNVNYDTLALANDVALELYQCYDSTLCFKVRFRNCNSESYGLVNSFVTFSVAPTDSTYGATILKFKWDYLNSYDEDRGEASVDIILIDYVNAPIFSASILVHNTNDVLKFDGYLE